MARGDPPDSNHLIAHEKTAPQNISFQHPPARHFSDSQDPSQKNGQFSDSAGRIGKWEACFSDSNPGWAGKIPAGSEKRPQKIIPTREWVFSLTSKPTITPGPTAVARRLAITATRTQCDGILEFAQGAHGLLETTSP